MLKEGNPGPWPGAGRPKNAFRERCRKVSEENIGVIEKIITGKLKINDQEPGFADRRQAWKDIATMGFGEAKMLIPEDLTAVLGDWIGEWVDPGKIEEATQDLFKRLG